MIAVAGASLAGCGPAPRGRAILVHGLGSTAASYRNKAPFGVFAAGMVAQGWALDVMPYRTEGRGPDHGATLQSLFDEDPTGATVLEMWLEDYEERVARLPAVDGPTLLIGISWGGLLTLQAAGRARVPPDAYIAHIPATEPRRLQEFRDYDLSVLSAFDEPAMTMPGLLSWATDDHRTGHQVTAALAARLGCDAKQYDSLGHKTTLEVVGHLMGWSAQLLDS
jgi:predicted alpha/beta hydrolase family esterase